MYRQLERLRLLYSHTILVNALCQECQKEWMALSPGAEDSVHPLRMYGKYIWNMHVGHIEFGF